MLYIDLNRPNQKNDECRESCQMCPKIGLRRMRLSLRSIRLSARIHTMYTSPGTVHILFHHYRYCYHLLSIRTFLAPGIPTFRQHDFAEATSPPWLCFYEQLTAAQLWVFEEQGSSGLFGQSTIRTRGYQNHEKTHHSGDLRWKLKILRQLGSFWPQISNLAGRESPKL